jgi:serine/threonine protein kinase
MRCAHRKSCSFVVKFENIMWEDQGPDAEIKVIDFGLSKKFGYGERDVMRAGVGTIYTMAPQVLQGVYTSQADLWSVGVITYMLLSSTRPFRHRRRKGMIDQIMRADYVKDGDRWVGISDEAKDMVKQLLELDPKLRLNATLALQHKWLSKDCDISDRKPIEVAEKVKESLVTYQNSSQMKKIALNIIAHRSSTAEILELRKAFDQYDTSNDGVIELYEFEAAMKQANYSDEDIDKMFGSVVSCGVVGKCMFDFAGLIARTYVSRFILLLS